MGLLNPPTFHAGDPWAAAPSGHAATPATAARPCRNSRRCDTGKIVADGRVIRRPPGRRQGALVAFAGEYERKAQVVELRFFGGLSVEETAEVLRISPETVMRDWKFAKGWLMRELSRARERSS